VKLTSITKRLIRVDYPLPIGSDVIVVTGQACRTVIALIDNPKGVTSGGLSVRGWGYCTSEYLRSLRHNYGLEIETIKETHYGRDGKGWHGRYRLITNAEASDLIGGV